RCGHSRRMRCCWSSPRCSPRSIPFVWSRRCRSRRRCATRSPSDGRAMIAARELAKSFAMLAGPVHALRGVSLTIVAGEYLAIRGPSGCGKSTLLHILGCVDTPTSGTLVFDGRAVEALPDADRSQLRLLAIGFVFQRFFLLPMLTAAENIEVPQ